MVMSTMLYKERGLKMTDYSKGIYVWGTGLNAKRLNEVYHYELTQEPLAGYIDNDPKKWGNMYYGKPVFSPDSIRELEDIAIYISVNKSDEIIEQIRNSFSSKTIVLKKNYFQKKRLMTRYAESENPEINEIIEYLYNHDLDVFNYSWVDDYKSFCLEFYKEDGLIYVVHKGKKLFFSKKYDTKEKVREYYISLLIEQHAKSPHLYLTSEFDVSIGDVVVDAGAAEGIFSLEVIDRAKRIYIFEPDSDWIEALKHTFADYKDKVVIIQRCVSNYKDKMTTTIDEVVTESAINFLKMDIEGEEFYALCGAENTLKKSNNVKCVVCSYHQEFAYYAIKSKLEEYGFKTKHSDGYMWYIEHFNSMRPMTLRRGLVRAEK